MRFAIFALMMLAAAAAMAGEKPRHQFDLSTLKPFTTPVMVEGQQTGLYPGGKNEVPEAHLKAGLKLAETIQPLDENGNPDAAKGRILAVNIGHSNCKMYFGELKKYFVTEKRSELNPRFELLNCGVGSQQLPEIHEPDCPVWKEITDQTSKQGYSIKQVQVLFLHTTWHGPRNRVGAPEPFPAEMKKMQSYMHDVLKRCAQMMPNLKIAYLTSDGLRHFTNLEPHVWREAFAFKWMIEAQIKGEAGTAFEGPNRALPWLQWGAYIWDPTWDKSYFADDGVHPAGKGRDAFVEKYWAFLTKDPIAKHWLFKK